MRASAISHGIANLKDGEEFTGKHLVQWTIEALEITESVPDFTFNSKDEIVNYQFWDHLESETVTIVFSLKWQKDLDRMRNVISAIGSVFNTTVGDILFKRWLQFSCFLKDLQEKCTNEILKVFSASIGVTLLNKFVKVEQFAESDDIIKSMQFCFKCGDVLATALSRLHGRTKICKFMHTEYVNCIDEYFDLIGRNPIFLTHSFYQCTKIILEKGAAAVDDKALTKYLNVLSSMLDPEVGSNANEKMYEYCANAPQTNHLVKLTVLKRRVSRSQRLSVFSILESLIRYSRSNNKRFACDWPRVFAYTLYSADAEIRCASHDLFLLEAQLTEQNETATQYTLLEKAINSYIRNKTNPNIKEFIFLFKRSEDFLKCEKLFDLLREKENVEKKLFMCKVIIKIITYTANSMAEHNDPTSLERLKKNVFRHIEFVEPYPQLLCGLLSSIKLSEVKDEEMFREQMLLVEKPVLNAFFQCDEYGTAIGLLKILQDIGSDDSWKQLSCMFDTHADKNLTGNRRKKLLILFLAADDIFNIFSRIQVNDKSCVHSYFRKCFLAADEIESKALYAALIVKIQKTYAAPDNTAEAEINSIHRYLSDRVVDRTNPLFASMILAIAYLDHHLTNPTLPIESHCLNKILRILADISFAYREFFEKDDEIMDLGLIVKFYRTLHSFYEIDQDIVGNPGPLFEYYLYAHDHLVKHVEELIFKMLLWRHDEDPYKVFADIVSENMYANKPGTSLKPLLKKLFDLIKASPTNFDTSEIAMRIFSKNLELVDSDRPKTIWNVQSYLYKDYINNIHREVILRLLNEIIERGIGGENFKTFLKYLQDGRFPITEPQLPEEDDHSLSDASMRSDSPHGSVDQSGQDRVISPTTSRRSTLRSIDLSMN